MKSLTPSLGPGQSPREGVQDAIHRFVEALDTGSEPLIRSAFTSNGIVDLSGLTPCTGREYTLAIGIEPIVTRIHSHLSSMDSAHHLSNFRVKLDEKQERAEVTVYAWAQHFRKGEGVKGYEEGKREFVLGNHYWADVVKTNDEGGLWKIERIEVTCMWSTGDIGVVM